MSRRCQPPVESFSMSSPADAMRRPRATEAPERSKPMSRETYPFRVEYVASSTSPSHSVLVSSPGYSNARWLNQESAAAPCQCGVFAGTSTMLPGCRRCAGLPSSWYQPSPSTQMRTCPPPREARCVCQLLRHPGSNVTLKIGR